MGIELKKGETQRGVLNERDTGFGLNLTEEKFNGLVLRLANQVELDIVLLTQKGSDQNRENRWEKMFEGDPNSVQRQIASVHRSLDAGREFRTRLELSPKQIITGCGIFDRLVRDPSAAYLLTCMALDRKKSADGRGGEFSAYGLDLSFGEEVVAGLWPNTRVTNLLLSEMTLNGVIVATLLNPIENPVDQNTSHIFPNGQV